MNVNLDTVQYGRNTQFFLGGTHLYFLPTLLVRPHDDPLFLNMTTYLHQQQHFIYHGIGCPVYSLLCVNLGFRLEKIKLIILHYVFFLVSDFNCLFCFLETKLTLWENTYAFWQ